MNYRRNKKRGKIVVTIIVLVVVLVIVILGFGRKQLTNIFFPVFALGASAEAASDGLFEHLQSKDELIATINKLTERNKELRHENRDRALLLHENRELKIELGRGMDQEPLTLTRVISVSYTHLTLPTI